MNTFAAMVVRALVTTVVAYVTVIYVNRNAEKPLPPGTYDDLPSVLKALYLQQKFSDFVVEGQSAKPNELHAQFGAFLEKHKPGDKREPSQQPGVISSAQQ